MITISTTYIFRYTQIRAITTVLIVVTRKYETIRCYVCCLHQMFKN